MISKNNINKTEQEDDDDMPELEDLSEELGKIRQKLNKDNESDSSEIKINVINNNSNNSSKQQSSQQSVNIPISSGSSTNTTPTVTPTMHPTPNTTPSAPATSTPASQKQEEPSAFLFKKGFFLRNQEQSNSSNDNNTNKNTSTNTDINKTNNNSNNNNNNNVIDLTHLKPTGESVKDKFISQIKTEVKENSTDINKSLNYIQDKKDEWCNTNLLSAIAQKPSLMKFFMDPRFAEAIQIMQKDPQKFMQTYGKNPEFNEFIKEFSSIMSGHFNKIGEENQTQQPTMDKEIEKIIGEPKVKMVIERLQREGKLDVNEIQRDPELAMKIKTLIDKGFLKLQRE